MRLAWRRGWGTAAGVDASAKGCGVAGALVCGSSDRLDGPMSALLKQAVTRSGRAVPGVITARANRWLPPVVLILAVAALSVPGFWDPRLSSDEQSLVVSADRILGGDVPHRDFFVTYGPMGYYLLAAAFAVGAPGFEAERIVAAGIHIALALGVYGIARGRGPTFAVAAGLTAAVLVSFLLPIAHPWLGGLGCVLLAIALLAEVPSQSRRLLAGVLLAVATLWRPDMSVLSLVAVLPFAISLGRGLVEVIAGAALGAVPGAVFVAVAGRQWVENTLTRAGADATYASLDPYVVVGAVVLALATVTIGILGWRRREPAAVSVGAVTLVSFGQLAQRPDVTHLLFVTVAALPLLPVLVIPRGDGSSSQSSSRSMLMVIVARSWAGGTLAIAAVVGVAALAAQPWRDIVHVSHEGRSVLATPEDAQGMTTTAEVLRSSAGSGPVFVGAQDMSRPTLTWPLFYLLVPRRQVQAYYMEIPPGITRAQEDRLIEDITSAESLLLSKFSDEQRAEMFPKLPDGTQRPNEAVRRGFCTEQATPFGDVMRRQSPCGERKG